MQQYYSCGLQPVCCSMAVAYPVLFTRHAVFAFAFFMYECCIPLQETMSHRNLRLSTTCDRLDQLTLFMLLTEVVLNKSL